MSAIYVDDGGPAFPVVAENGLGHISHGMSLRAWIAGQALIGLISNDNGLLRLTNMDHEHLPSKRVALCALTVADALIKELKA